MTYAVSGEIQPRLHTQRSTNQAERIRPSASRFIHHGRCQYSKKIFIEKHKVYQIDDIGSVSTVIVRRRLLFQCNVKRQTSSVKRQTSNVNVDVDVHVNTACDVSVLYDVISSDNTSGNNNSKCVGECGSA